MSELAARRRRLKCEREALAGLRRHDIEYSRANYRNTSATFSPKGFSTPIVKVIAVDGAHPDDVDRFIEAIKRLVRS